jgi:hypothetical protein
MVRTEMEHLECQNGAKSDSTTANRYLEVVGHGNSLGFGECIGYRFILLLDFEQEFSTNPYPEPQWDKWLLYFLCIYISFFNFRQHGIAEGQM